MFSACFMGSPAGFFFTHHRIPKCMFASSPVVSPRDVSNKGSFGECLKRKIVSPSCADQQNCNEVNFSVM